MVDYCLCKGGECPIKEKCYRYRAKWDDYIQSYFITPPYLLKLEEVYNCKQWFDTPTKEQEICEEYLDASKWGLNDR